MYICHPKQQVGGADSLSGSLREWVSNILPLNLPKLIISIRQLELYSVRMQCQEVLVCFQW